MRPISGCRGVRAWSSVFVGWPGQAAALWPAHRAAHRRLKPPRHRGPRRRQANRSPARLSSSFVGSHCKAGCDALGRPRLLATCDPGVRAQSSVRGRSAQSNVRDSLDSWHRAVARGPQGHCTVSWARIAGVQRFRSATASPLYSRCRPFADDCDGQLCGRLPGRIYQERCCHADRVPTAGSSERMLSNRSNGLSSTYLQSRMRSSIRAPIVLRTTSGPVLGQQWTQSTWPRACCRICRQR